MMALREPMALAALLIPSALAAQLTITVSPSSNVVQPGATLKFRATVPKSTSPWKSYVLSCSEPATGCGYPRAHPSTVAELGKAHVLTFESYTVPSSLKPGATLCFGVYTLGWHLKPVVVASACRQVSAPYVAADDAAKAATTASATPAISPRGSTQRTRTASSGGARSATTARTTVGALPDLVITFEKGPVARWIVLNVGTANAAATSVEFRRLGVSGSKSHSVGGLAPGASAVITVTPELDIYLVNSTADVDPSATIVELDETNNRWASATSR
jgi:hypothetical protein